MATRRREPDDDREKAEKAKPARSAPFSCPVPAKGRRAGCWGWNKSTGSEGKGCR